MTLTVEEDEATDPFDTSLVGADRIMFYPQVPANPVEQFSGASNGSSGWGQVRDFLRTVVLWQVK